MNEKKLTGPEMVSRAKELLYGGQAYENRVEIFQLLFDALDLEQWEAAYLLRGVYQNMEITEEDFDKSMAYFELSKNPNDTEGLYVWACDIRSSRPDKALSLFKKSAYLGYVAAMLEYGRLIFKTSPYVGFDYILKAADSGNSEAMFEISLLFCRKYSLNYDIEKAFLYIKKSADAGYQKAYFYLAYMYEYGTGVEQDYTLAHQYFEKVQDIHYYYTAVGYIGLHMIYGRGVEQNVTDGIKLLIEACDFGVDFPELYVELGKCYERGIGVEINFELADKYFALAKRNIECNQRI